MKKSKRNGKTKSNDKVGMSYDETLPYDIIERDDVYHGKTYNDLVQDWLNWFLSIDADKRTLGPVVFLRSKGLDHTQGRTTNRETGMSEDQSASVTYDDDFFYPRKYVNNPNVRVGNDKIQIYSDQAVFIPIIVGFWVATKPFHDWGFMQEFNGATIDYGDNPPGKDQFKIYDMENDYSPNVNLEYFRVSTSIFTAVVPESDYGRSNKDFLEESVLPGHYPAMVDGYFVLIKFKEQEDDKAPQDPKSYFVHAWASAPRETRGPYFSELLYEIEVRERPDKGIGSKGSPGFRPATSEGAIVKLLRQKIKSGELKTPVGKRAGSILGINIEELKGVSDGE